MSYQEQLKQFPVVEGFRIRGEAMTRVEVFTDAAFAFAVTMLAVSLDGIPKNYNDFIVALKDIPAFAASFAQITIFWYAHRQWSQKYGLEDLKTVFISCLLIFSVLVFVFPLKISFGAFFYWASGGYLTPPMEFNAEQIKTFFIIFHLSFFVMCFVIRWLYQHAKSKHQELMLNELELFETQTQIRGWNIMLVTTLIGLLLAILLSNYYSAMSGSIYGTLGFSMAINGARRNKQKAALFPQKPAQTD